MLITRQPGAGKSSSTGVMLFSGVGGSRSRFGGLFGGISLGLRRLWRFGLGISRGCGLSSSFGYYCGFGCQVEEHALAFELGQLLYFGQILEGLGKLEQQDFAPLLEDNATAYEMHIALDFRAFAQKLLGVLHFESEVVLVGVGAETDFLKDNLSLLGLELTGLFLLLVLEFRVVDDAANGRRGRGEISTRSRFCSWAILRAWSVG